MSRKVSSLRPDTAVMQVSGGEGYGREVYVHQMPGCCLRSLKEEVVGGGQGRALSLGCSGCGREWRVTSSLDERVLGRFVTHAGPRVGGYPAA